MDRTSRRDLLKQSVGLCCAPVLAGASAEAAALRRDDQPKIDIYNHIMPPAYLDRLRRGGRDPGLAKRVSAIRALWDIDERLRILAPWPELQQVLTLSAPAPENIAGPEESPELARLANDGMAAICRAHPARFPAFAATLPLNNVGASLREMDRAIGDLGAKGIEIRTNVNGRPLDDPAFLPIFERATNHHGVAIWMHPARSASMTDYAAEPRSRYEIWQVMGWPYETTAAMARIVFSGMLDRLPEMRIITHHCGGMLPYFAGRADALWQQLGSRTSDEDYSHVLSNLKRPFMDYFRMFYGDTVLGGSTAALRCGLDFFGPDHVVFASDCPFDPEAGPRFIRDGIASIEALRLPSAVKTKLYRSNAQSLLQPRNPPPRTDEI